MKGSPLKITIVHHTIALDPELAVWNVIVKSPTGVWHESYGSRGLVDAFVQGVRCGAVQAAGRLVLGPGAFVKGGAVGGAEVSILGGRVAGDVYVDQVEALL